MKTIAVTPNVHISNQHPLILIGGPCSIESREHALLMSSSLADICREVGIPFIYKSSFDKANRTSINSRRGVGIEQGAEILQEVRESGIPVITDVHLPEQCAVLKSCVDVLQIPAFLCRQTDLLIAAGETGLPINVKKGQFMAPWDMKNVVAKIASTGNTDVMLTERGTTFGYNTLINDMRGLVTMAETGQPVIFDATHSVQQPAALGETSGGQREFVFPLARAAVAVGVAGVFMEIHDDPDNALSDGPNSVYLKDVKRMLTHLQLLDIVAKEDVP